MTFNATEILVFAGMKTTVKFYKKCEISNTLGEAEDNILFEEKENLEN
jgi:hypothetical protein